MTHPPIRKDHYVPQGFLRGFIHPGRLREQKPLWVHRRSSQAWTEQSTSEVCFEEAFYRARSGPAKAFDFESVFKAPERAFPLVRDRIRLLGYDLWPTYKRILVGTAALLSARNRLFMEQAQAGRPAAPHSAKDEALHQMALELQRRPLAWLSRHWALQYTTDADNGLPTCDSPVVVEGVVPDPVEAWTHPATTIIFPLAWDMVLFGASVPLSPLTGRLPSFNLEKIRDLMRKSALEFFVAPLPLIDTGV